MQPDISTYFPIESQTSPDDRLFLFRVMQMIGQDTGGYNYLELGSYMGGSVAPFLLDDKCLSILSVDERGRQQPDDRGALYDYTSVTSQKMIDNLRAHGLNTAKLQVFDRSIENLGTLDKGFQLAFIDGEHTDWATFRDFIYVLDYVMKDSVILFHDSYFVGKGLKLINTLMDKSGANVNGPYPLPESMPHKFFKKSKCSMSAIFFGKYAQLDLDQVFGEREDPDAFYDLAADIVLDMNLRHRVKIQFKIEKPTVQPMM